MEKWWEKNWINICATSQISFLFVRILEQHCTVGFCMTRWYCKYWRHWTVGQIFFLVFWHKINMLHLCMLWELKLDVWNSNNPHGVCPYNDSTPYNLLAKVSNCKTLFWDKNCKVYTNLSSHLISQYAA